jgi:hypothetical protein
MICLTAFGTIAVPILPAHSKTVSAEQVSEAKDSAKEQPFQFLPISAVRPRGWLQSELLKQSKGLTSHLTKLYEPFTGSAWAADETSAKSSWVPWEVRAYWCDGALRCGILLQDEALIAQASQLLDFTFDHPQSDGYLGPSFLKPTGEYHRWPHTVFFRAAAAWYDWSQQAHIVEGLSRHYLGSSYKFSGSREHTNIEAILWTYRLTGDPKLLSLSEDIWARSQKDFLAQPINVDLTEHAMVSPGRVKRMHGVTYAEHSKLPALLYMAAGNPHYRDVSIAAFRKIAEHHVLADGGVSSTERLSTTTGRDAHETCDIVDYSWSWGYMLSATRNGEYGDHIEKATFNALPGAIRKDWKALQYYSSPNQFLCTATSNHLAVTKGTDLKTLREHHYLQRMSYRPSPGYAVVCCPANLNRGLPNYVARMWMSEARSGGLVAALFGPCRVEAGVGSHRLPITITEETNYPYSDEIVFHMQMSETVIFPFYLRIPSWCNRPAVFLNEKELAMPPTENGFIVIRRAWSSGDKVLLRLPAEITTAEWPEDGLTIERGPLLFAYPISQQWKKISDERSSPTFPAWDLTPDADWNYTLLPEGEASAPVYTNNSVVDPWNEPSATIRVSVRQVENWKLTETMVDGENVTFTPRLPDPATLDSDVTGPIKEIELILYGNTELRLSVFPHMKVITERMPGA